MNAQEILNAAYANLCSQLGHLIMQKAALQAKIDEVTSQISHLNLATPVVVSSLKSSDNKDKTDAS